MNVKRKAKKAYQLWDYYFYKKNIKFDNDIKGMKQYERALSFSSERYYLSEDLLYKLAKLCYYSWECLKAEKYIKFCILISAWCFKAYELQSQILGDVWKDKEAKASLEHYNRKMKELDETEFDLEAFYKR